MGTPADDPHKYFGSFAISGLSIPDNNNVVGNAVDMDQQIARPAISDLYGSISGEGSTPEPGYLDERDKKLYFGFSSERYADYPGAEEMGFPKAAYMFYTRIQKESYYFDAIVTFLPRAKNGTYADPTSHKDEFFIYEVH